LAESGDLTTLPPDREPVNRGRRASDSGPGAGYGLYLTIALSLLLLGVLLPAGGGPTGGSNRGGLLVLETVTATLALILGSLSLVRYYSRRRRTYLFLGVGFLATAILDLLALAAHPVWSLTDATAASAGLLQWSWLLSRGFLAVYLFLALQAARGDAPPIPRIEGDRNVFLVGVGALAVTVVVFAILPFGPLRLSGPYPRPLDLIPAVFFGLTALGYLRRRNWHRDVFERWFIAGLLVSCLLHLLFTGRSVVDADLPYVVGHLLKAVSYAFILTGVLMGVHITFRREERALEAIQEMNEVLEREVEVRREAEVVLQRSEERLQNFLDTAHDLIQSTAPDGEILYVNPAWERTLGYSRRELKSLTLSELIHPSYRERVMEQYDAVLDTGGAPSIEVEFLTRDGRVVICSGSATRHMVDGRAVAVSLTVPGIERNNDAFGYG